MREMVAPKPDTGNHRIVLSLLGVLMVSHLTFMGFRTDKPETFQRAAETYVAILLALMTPLAPK